MPSSQRKLRPAPEPFDQSEQRPVALALRSVPKPKARGHDEPMTDMQACYLKTLSEDADEPDAFDVKLTKREAA
jgi:hypothetical protein